MRKEFSEIDLFSVMEVVIYGTSCCLCVNVGIRGAWYGGYVLDFRPGGPGSIPGVDVNMN